MPRKYSQSVECDSWQGGKYFPSSFPRSSQSVHLQATGILPSNECPCAEDHIDTHFNSSTVMTDRAAQQDLDLIELALCRLLHDDKPHDPHGEDAESKLIRDEKDRDLLIRLLDQLNSLKAERGQKDCETSLPTDDRNPDTEPRGSDKIGGQVKNEEVMEEIRKVKKQNKLTHLMLGIILASNVIWRLSELAMALLIRKQISNPLKLIGNFINFKGPVTQNHGNSHNLRASLQSRIEAPAIPHFEAPQLPHIEMPSFFQTEDKALHIANGKPANESAGQAQ